jgi:hypothetical protein
MAGCVSSPVKEISKEVEKYGYTVYNPPRADHGPGWVFHFAKTFDGKTVPVAVCQNLYPDDRTQAASISFPTVTRNDTTDLSFGVSLLEGLVTDVQKASASLEAKKVKKLTITWGDLVATELPEERKFGADGKLLPISNSCAARLRELRRQNQMESVYLVQSAVLAKSMKISVDEQQNAGASLDASLYKVLDVKPSAKVSTTSNSSIDVSDPRYIGFVALAVLDWIPLDQVGPETAKVSGRLLSPADVSELMKSGKLWQ